MKRTKFCTFYIVRHAQTEWNIEKKLQGHKDSPLTEKGILQTKELGEELKKIKFDGVFSSDSLRAHKTAEILTAERNLAIKTTQLLRERSFGKWEGASYDVFDNELKDAWDNFLLLSEKEKKFFRYPDTESDEEMIERLFRFLRETAIAYPAKTLLIVSHGGTIRNLLIHLGYGTYSEITAHSVKNNAVVKLESDGVEFIIGEIKGVIKE